VLSERANFFYKATRFYHAAGGRCVCWNDAQLKIGWPLSSIGEPAGSAKDAAGTFLNEAELPEANLD
jgi:dTDP-4-dehydrorhamnose 3,5-epimerase